MLTQIDCMLGNKVSKLIKVGYRIGESNCNLFSYLPMGNILLFLATTFDDLP